MVHNGIEYADMQLIAESFLLLKYAGGFTNRELADIYRTWNEGELHSYLIGITADIFLEADDMADGDIIDHILDSAGQKGTGRWASIESLKQGVDISMITAACNARVMSNHLERRQKASSLVHAPAVTAVEDKQAFAEMVREALYTGKIIAYAQGFSLMQDASHRFGWNLDLGTIASIFRAGCIIQAEFLNDITKAFLKEPELESLIFDDFFLSRINRYQENLRKTTGLAISSGLPVPAFFNAVSYLDSFRAKASGANLIQAQRDFFGAHTFERIDRKGIFHHEWRAGMKYDTCITIFGGTGDLTFRKLLPALYTMSRTRKLPARSKILLIGRRDYDTASYTALARDWIRRFSRLPYSEESFADFAGHLEYYRMDFPTGRPMKDWNNRMRQYRRRPISSILLSPPAFFRHCGGSEDVFQFKRRKNHH